MATGMNGSLEIGRRIRDLREKKGITQKEFASLMHVSQGRVSQIERGAGIPDGMLPLICSIFKVKEEYILKGIADDGGGYRYLDTGSNYRNAVDAMLWKCGYKKLKHPVPCNPNMKLDNTDPDYKAISKILRRTDCTIYVHSKPVFDDDCIGGTDEMLLPPMTYTFAFRCVALSSGYNWEAFEIDRAIDKLRLSEFTEKAEDSLDSYENTYPDEVDFVPYHFKMYTPDSTSFVSESMYSNKSYTVTQDKLWRYRKAADKAKFLNHCVPRDVDDDYFINRECPEAIRYLEDGSVDWDHEYSRFFDMINDHVSGRTLSSSNEMVERGKRCMNTVVYSGKERDLLSYGRMRIVCDTTGEVGFIVDDRKITGEQFLNMLTDFEGWTLNYEMDSY